MSYQLYDSRHIICTVSGNESEGLIAERISARHLILQHALGQCIYICPSRSSAHARAGA